MAETTNGKQTDGQVAWVFDLNKCMGCPTCVVACRDLWCTDEDMKDQWWCTVATKPGEGHPRGWEEMGGGYDEDGNLVRGDQPGAEDVHDFVELPWSEGRPKGDPPEMRAEDPPEWTFNWEEDEGGGEHPNSWQFYLPRICMQCSRPSCLEACPTDSLVKREEDGVVLINEDSCEGNRYCQQACPYKVIWFNEDRGNSEIPGVSQMCIGCVPRLEEGVAPACARACPGRVVHFGHLNNEESSVHQLVKKWEVALPLHPEYNTGPNVYYVPPMSASRLDEDGEFTDEPRIPQEYLESLFGERVGEALETIKRHRKKVENGGESELIDLLVGWRWPDDFFGSYTNHPDEAFVEKSE